MKVITWNCNMAFRKKYENIMLQKPDLLILQECENESKLKTALDSIDYNQIIWYGNNPHKGVAAISFNNVNIELMDDHNPAFEFIIPIKMYVGKHQINLFAIWAMPHKTERKRDYVGQIWYAINYYSKYLDQKSILIGDFNSNTIWDKKKRIGNHSHVVEFLNQKNIFSVYHQKQNIHHGREEHPTLFLLKKIDKPYHLDYIFLSNELFSKKTSISIGTYEDWIKLSDHMPLIVDWINP